MRAAGEPVEYKLNIQYMRTANNRKASQWDSAWNSVLYQKRVWSIHLPLIVFFNWAFLFSLRFFLVPSGFEAVVAMTARARRCRPTSSLGWRPIMDTAS